MKKIPLFILSLPLALLFSCGNGGRSNTTSNNDTIAETRTQGQQVITPSDSGVVNVPLSDGRGVVTVRKKADQMVTLQFTVDGYRKLNGYLTSKDSIANIRFSQITLPDGTMDGPFGREITYDLPADGTYRISIHESLMAGDPWSGIFTARIELTR